MARTRFFSFRCEDSTELLNDKYRGMLESGVYIGFTVGVGGSGGLYLKFTHDTDPDNPASWLGSFLTPDGVVIQEDDQEQDDVVIGSMSAGTPNIHYVVASYTYNQDLPANDVVYAIRQGVSGSPPTPPTLTDDETLLAIIDIPSGATGYDSAGVDIKTVGKKDLYGVSTKELYEAFAGVLDPGIYDGMEMSEGTTSLDITAAAGSWITQENIRITEAAAQTDLFTITDPNAGNYRLCWFIGMHKSEDTDPVPDVDYLLVEGSVVAVGAEASLPNNTAILAAAAAVNAKYDDASYINKLGIVRVENRASTYYIDYIKGTSILDPDSLVVYGAEASSFNRSGKYYGGEGLVQAVADVYALIGDNADLDEAYTIWLDGSVKLPDVAFQVPSNVRVKGLGAAAKILSEATDETVKAHGKLTTYVPSTNTVTLDTDISTTEKQFSITATYQTGDNYNERMISAGDIVGVFSDANGAYTGTVKSVDGNWQITVLFDNTDYNDDGNPLDLDILIFKRNIHFENLEVNRINAGGGELSMKFLERSGVDNVVCYDFVQAGVYRSKFGKLRVLNDVSWEGSSGDFGGGAITSQGNLFEYLHLQGAGNDTLFAYENKLTVGVVIKDQDNAVIASTGCSILSIFGNVTISGSDINIFMVTGTITDSAANKADWRVLFSETITKDKSFGEALNQDRNLRLVGQGVVRWTLATSTLSIEDDDILIDLPTTTGRNKLVNGSSWVVADGDRVYVDLDRAATTDAAVTGTVQTKAAAGTSHRMPDRLNFAIRQGDEILLYDGTRLEDGMSVKTGQTPPPDGSVTFAKLADDALAFHNEFFRDYVVPTDFTNSFVFLNTGLATIAYTIGTGVVQYTGTADLQAAKDLLDAGVPLTLLLPNILFPNHDGMAREQILAINVGAKTVTIDKGLGITSYVGAASKWNGAILQGNKALSNDGLASATYTDTTGRIALSPNTNFTQYQVGVGYVFVDNNGVKYPILARDTSGNGAWIDIQKNLRDVSVGTPTGSDGCTIELNNNPLDLSLGDLKCLIGGEFIPIDTYGGLDMQSSGNLIRLAYPDEFVGLERRFIQPYDKRVRVHSGFTRTADVNEPSDAAGNNRLHYGDQQMSLVEFTGVCTGVVLIVGGGGADTDMDYWVDGDRFDNEYQYHGGSYDNYFGMEHTRYEAVAQETYYPVRLPQGLHHVMWQVDSSAVIRGILVFNTPSTSDLVSEAPGKLVRNGGVETYIQQQRSGAVPTPGSGWNKGGRSIRYLDSAGAAQWESEFVRNFTDTGDTVGTTSITNVAGPTQWRVGDILMVILSNVKYLRRISSIVGNTINVAGTALPSGGTTTIYYYGKMRDGTDVYRDPSEEQAQTYNIKEFAGAGPSNDNRSAVGDGSTRSNPIGVYLSDLETSFAANGVATNVFGRLNLAGTGSDVRFYFTGTGLSIDMRDTGRDLTVSVDGVAQVIPVAEERDDQKGYFICSELPYGTHLINIELDASPTPDLNIVSVTVWQPKKPTVTGFELLDTCVVGISEQELGITAVDGLDTMQIGTIRQDWGSIAHFEQSGGGTFEDSAQGYAFASACRAFSVNTAVFDDRIHTVFYGDEITLITKSVTTNPPQVWLRDNDGTYKQPSSIVGFTVVETAGDTLAVHATAGTRYRYKFDKLGMHTIMIRMMNGGDNITLDAIEIHPPFHNNNSKDPVGIDHMLPWQFGGLDLRNESPVNNMLMSPPALEHTQGAWLQAQAQAYTDEQKMFMFYTKGGLTEIEVTSRVQDSVISAANLEWWIEIDNVQDGPPGSIFYNTAISSGAIHDSVSVKRIITLDPGFHYARLMSDSTSDYVKHTKWSVKSIEPYQNGVLSRGLPSPGFGPVNPGDFGI